VDAETGSKRYFTVREIAAGGMGSVALVVRREGSFHRLFAVKRLHTQFRDDPDFRAMFLDEARIAGLLRHPNVVSVLDVGEDREGPYLLMEYVEGVTLHGLIARAGRDGVLIPVSVAVEIAMHAAEGLHVAHELRSPEGEPLGLVHRDVSPQNILVGFDGVARLTDFGVAKAYGRSTRTSTGVLKGKFGYMSPESLRFEDLDRRSDLFSLGVVLFELLSGKRLYSGTDGTTSARRILSEPPPDVGQEREDVTPELVELLFELLAKEAGHRPASARVVADRLALVSQAVRYLDDESPSLRDYMRARFEDEAKKQTDELRKAIAMLDRGELTSVEWPRPEPKRSRRTVAIAGGAIAVGLGTLGAGVWLGQLFAAPPAEVEPPTAELASPRIVNVERDGEPEEAVPDAGPAEAAAETRDRRRIQRRARAEIAAMGSMESMDAPAMAEAPTEMTAASVRPIGWDEQ
jgi:serine/threonine-protein kinase